MPRCSTGGTAAAGGTSTSISRTWGTRFVPTTASSGRTATAAPTARPGKFLDLWGFNEVSPYLNAEYKTDRGGKVQYRQNNLGLRLGLPRATTIFTEVRINNLVAVRPGGGLRKRDQFFIGIESNPASWFSKLYSEIAVGDRVDVVNNRVGRGAFINFSANLRPHPRAEVEYRIDNDWIDSKQPVSAREKSDTLALVYGHRRGLAFTVYLGATFGRTEDADAGFRRYQSEVFAKGSWTFDVL